MSVKVASNRFIVPSKYAALYQQLITVSDFHRLGRWLVNECEKAQAFRQTNKLSELSLILSGIPLQEYQLIGQFYQGYSHASKNPRILLEGVAEKSDAYRSKALIALATLELGAGNYDSGIQFCNEAIQQSHSISTIIHAARSTAVIKSAEGFHTAALKDLEVITPLIRYASPIARYQYLNSLAVEFGEAGRIEEALKVCQITLASPYAFAYPEWRETGQDLALRAYRSRSSVRILQTFPRNVVQMPSREPSEPSDTRTHPAIFGPAPVVGLKEWIEDKMVKEPNGDDDINPDKMSEQDMVMKLIQMLTTGEGDEKKIRELLKSAFKIFYGK